ALLDPQVLDVELLAVPLGPVEVRVALEHRHDVLVVDERNDPLLLAPDAGAVGIDVAPLAIVEELHPGRRRARVERLGVVVNLEQVAAGRAAVDDLEQAVLAGAAVDALEPGVVAHVRASIPDPSSAPERPAALPSPA